MLHYHCSFFEEDCHYSFVYDLSHNIYPKKKKDNIKKFKPCVTLSFLL